jgi:hypothetical protein
MRYRFMKVKGVSSSASPAVIEEEPRAGSAARPGKLD